MGNDGGTIAKRKDFLSLHSLDNNEPQTGEDCENTLLVTCGLSSLPLDQGPVVGDWKGQLYLKEKAIGYILDQKLKHKKGKHVLKKEFTGRALPQIKSIKDLVDIKITWGKEDDTLIIKCPVTQEGSSKNFTYAYLRSCGCLMAYKVLQELGKLLKVTKGPDESECPNCGKKFHYAYDIVILNPLSIDSSTSFNEMGFKHLQNMGLTHSKKEAKKKSENDRPKKKIKTG